MDFIHEERLKNIELHHDKKYYHIAKNTFCIKFLEMGRSKTFNSRLNKTLLLM